MQEYDYQEYDYQEQDNPQAESESISDIRAERAPLYRKLMRWLWILAGAGVLAIIIFFIGLSFTDLPSIQELENPKSELATEIYSHDLQVFGRFFSAGTNRIAVPPSEISENVTNALVATEDERYYDHSGIDFESLARAVVFLGKEGGGSTITQQLAKQLFTDKYANSIPERIMQKTKEWIISLRLERRYTKEEIIAMYLNKFDFLNNAIGIEAASEIYFDKSQSELTVEEAAVFVGMLKNPTIYNPNRYGERTQNRRNTVLNQMRKNEYITQAEYDSLKLLPLDMSSFKASTQSEGMAAYFRAELAKDVRALIADEKKSDGSNYNIYEDGLKIYTSIDVEMQKMAEAAMWKHMQKLQKDFEQHWRKMDPWKYKDKETTPYQMQLRQETLTRLIRESDRYQDLRPKYLSGVAGRLTKDIDGLRLRELDIDRVLAAEKNKRYLNNLVRRNLISEDMASAYRKVLKHPAFDELKAKFAELEKASEKVFNKEVKMKVFAYNDKMQKDTTMSPLDSIKYHQMFLQLGSMIADPHTGHVKAWVGGINHRYFKFDHVRTRRQVGSTFKPFVYATAIAQKGFSPCFQVDDMPYSIHPGESSFYLKEEWQPSNSNDQFSYEKLTLRQALRRSKNSVTVYLMKEIGSVEPVVNMVSGMGIDTRAKYPNGEYIVPRVPSIALGAADLTVQEMTGAYTTFANNGFSTKLAHILRVEDKNGRVLYEAIPANDPVLNPRYNYVMLDLLKHVSTTIHSQMKTVNGGKTGTTNNHVDGWYMGVTPNLIVGTWVGGDQNWIRFRNIDYGQGAVMARPFFVEFMQALESNKKLEWDTEAKFMRPPGDIGIELDCSAYERVDLEGAFDETGESIYDDGFGDELEFDLPPVDTTVIK
ncbi:MAG: transglycosylase domain-containing protein [Bacteroidota bacterium]